MGRPDGGPAAAREARRHRRAAVRSDEAQRLGPGAVTSPTHPQAAQPASVRWVRNQNGRWGSCTPSDRSIRVSERIQGFPDWVIDYVLLHELAHLVHANHNAGFWALVGALPPRRAGPRLPRGRVGGGRPGDDRGAEAAVRWGTCPAVSSSPLWVQPSGRRRASDLGQWRAALAEDLLDVLATMAEVSAAVAVPTGERDLVTRVGWPGLTARSWRSLDVVSVFAAAAADGYEQAAVVVGDVPDLPGMILAKLLRPLTTRPVAVAPARDGDGLLGLAPCCRRPVGCPPSPSTSSRPSACARSPRRRRTWPRPRAGTAFGHRPTWGTSTRAWRGGTPPAPARARTAGPRRIPRPRSASPKIPVIMT